MKIGKCIIIFISYKVSGFISGDDSSSLNSDNFASKDLEDDSSSPNSDNFASKINALENSEDQNLNLSDDKSDSDEENKKPNIFDNSTSTEDLESDDTNRNIRSHISRRNKRNKPKNKNKSRDFDPQFNIPKKSAGRKRRKGKKGHVIGKDHRKNPNRKSIESDDLDNYDKNTKEDESNTKEDESNTKEDESMTKEDESNNSDITEIFVPPVSASRHNKGKIRKHERKQKKNKDDEVSKSQKTGRNPNKKEKSHLKQKRKNRRQNENRNQDKKHSELNNTRRKRHQE